MPKTKKQDLHPYVADLQAKLDRVEGHSIDSTRLVLWLEDQLKQARKESARHSLDLSSPAYNVAIGKIHALAAMKEALTRKTGELGLNKQVEL